MRAIGLRRWRLRCEHPRQSSPQRTVAFRTLRDCLGAALATVRRLRKVNVVVGDHMAVKAGALNLIHVASSESIHHTMLKLRGWQGALRAACGVYLPAYQQPHPVFGEAP